MWEKRFPGGHLLCPRQAGRRVSAPGLLGAWYSVLVPLMAISVVVLPGGGGYAQTASMVKDIHANNGTSQGSAPASLCALDGDVFFCAETNGEGKELWKSDGTDAGTLLVMDILPGVEGSEPRFLTAFNGAVYFEANGGTYGAELWKTDGTPAGTVMVKDINPGSASSGPSRMTVVGSTLYFSARTEDSGWELWKTDGTTAGTVMVKDIYPGTGSGDPCSLVNVSGVLFFTASEPANLVGLWKSDGTSAGTVLVKSFIVSQPTCLTAVGSTLFLVAMSSFDQGFELWKSDGTTSGAVLVKDVNPGSPDSYLRDLANVGGTLFFSAVHASYGQELWKSDGTTAGTVLVKDIVVGTTDSFARYLTSFGGACYFCATNGTSGLELWRSDGTAGGTVLLKDIWSGSGSGFSLCGGPEFVQSGAYLYFAANSNSGPSGSRVMENRRHFRGHRACQGHPSWRSKFQPNTPHRLVRHIALQCGQRHRRRGTVAERRDFGRNDPRERHPFDLERFSHCGHGGSGWRAPLHGRRQYSRT